KSRVTRPARSTRLTRGSLRSDIATARASVARALRGGAGCDRTLARGSGGALGGGALGRSLALGRHLPLGAGDDGEHAHHVLAEPGAALRLLAPVPRGLVLEQRVRAAALAVDLVGQALAAPALHVEVLPAVARDQVLRLLDLRVDLVLVEPRVQDE